MRKFIFDTVTLTENKTTSKLHTGRGTVDSKDPSDVKYCSDNEEDDSNQRGRPTTSG